MSQKFKIKKGDNVIVTTGRDKGRTGEVLEVIPGATMDGKPVYRTIFEPTGATKKVNLVAERIRCGDLEITEKVKGTEVEVPAMIKALAKKKITVTIETHTLDEINDLYQTLCV